MINVRQFRWLAAVLLLIGGVAPVCAQTSTWVNVRTISTSMDVQSAAQGNLIVAAWKQAESVTWYHRATLAGQSYPLTASNSYVILEIMDMDELDVAHQVVTGQITSAASGQMTFSLTPDQSNLITNEYRGYLKYQQTNGSAVVNIGVLAVARVIVEYSPNSTNYSFIGTTLASIRSNAVTTLRIGSPTGTGAVTRTGSSTGVTYTIQFPANADQSVTNIGTGLTGNGTTTALAVDTNLFATTGYVAGVASGLLGTGTAASTYATISALSSSGAAHNARMDSITSGAAAVYATQSALGSASNALFSIATNKAAASYLNNLPAMFLPPGSLSFANSGRGHNATPHRIDVFGTNSIFALLGLYHTKGTNFPDTASYGGLETWQYTDSTTTTGWMIGARSPHVAGGLHDGAVSHLQWKIYGVAMSSTNHEMRINVRGGIGERVALRLDGDTGNMVISGRVTAASFAGDGSAITGVLPNAAMSNAFALAGSVVTAGQWNASVAGSSNLALAVAAGASNDVDALGLAVTNLHLATGVGVSNAQVVASNAFQTSGGSLSGNLNMGSNKITGVQSIRFASNDTYMAVNDELSITTSNGYPMWFNPGGDYRRFVMANQIGEYLVTNVQHWASITATSSVTLSATGTQAAAVSEHPVTASGYPAGTYPSKMTRFDTRYSGSVVYGWLGSFPFNSGSDGRNSMPVWYTSDSGASPETTNVFYGSWNFSPSSYVLFSDFTTYQTNAIKLYSGSVTQNQVGARNQAWFDGTNLVFGLGGTNWLRFGGVLNAF